MRIYQRGEIKRRKIDKFKIAMIIMMIIAIAFVAFETSILIGVIK